MNNAESPLSLLREYARILRALRAAGIMRSSNSPVADYAECLAAGALNLKLLNNSNAGFDGVDKSGQRFEIKGRRLTPENPSRQVSAIRQLAKKRFDFLVGVVFDEQFNVERACVVPHSIICEMCGFSSHSNSAIFHLRDSLWTLPSVKDVTQEFQAAQKSLEEGPDYC